LLKNPQAFGTPNKPADCLAAPAQLQQQTHHLHNSTQQSAGFDDGLRKAQVVVDAW
jgi:hypothetical protein